MRRIMYDRDTDTFIVLRQSKLNEQEQVLLDNEVNNSLHEFLHNINDALRDEYCDITLGETRLLIKRKKITGEVVGCSVPYNTCLVYAHSHWRFLDFYL